MSYTRIFIPLECEASGYGFKGRTPAGRCIVENKGSEARVSVWAQDLRPEARYELYIVFPHENGYTGVFAGKINPDAKGKAELRKEIEPHTLGDFKIEELAAAAIIVADTDNDMIVSPLCGYRGKAVPWRGNGRAAFTRQVLPSTDVSESLESLPIDIELPIQEEEECAPEPEAEIMPEPEAEIMPEIIPEAEMETEAETEMETEIMPEIVPEPPPRPRPSAPRTRKPKSEKTEKTVKAPRARKPVAPTEDIEASPANPPSWSEIISGVESDT